MASWNIRYLGSIPGLGKIISILFLITAIGLGGHAYNKSLYNTTFEFFHELAVTTPPEIPGLGREEFFLSMVGIFLILSTLNIFAHILNETIPADLRLKFADILYHVLGAIFLMVAGSLIIASSRSIHKVCKETDWTNWEGNPCQYRAQKDFAGVFGIFGSFIFGLIALLQLLRFHRSEDSVHGVVA